MDRVRRVMPLLAWIASLGAGIVLFTALGGPLAAPPLTDPSAWGAWAAARDPLVVSVAVLRLLVLGLAWYLVGVTTVGVAARLLRAAALVRAADALTIPVVRRLVRGALGVGLATAVAATAPASVRTAPAPGSASPAVVAAMHRIGGSADTAAMRRVDADDGSPGRASMHRVGGQGGSADTAAMRRLDRPRLERATGGDTDPATVRREVAPGEHLWAIAEQALVGALDREPTDDEVADYWLRLVEHNRERLADPDNPDLVYPGQVFELPDPTASA